MKPRPSRTAPVNPPAPRPAPDYYPPAVPPKHRLSSWQYGTKPAQRRIIEDAMIQKVRNRPGEWNAPPGDWDGPPGDWEAPPGEVDWPAGLGDGRNASGNAAPVKGMGCLPDVPDHRDRTFERFAEDFALQKGKLTQEAAETFGLKHLSALSGPWTGWQSQLRKLAARLAPRAHLGNLQDEEGNLRRLLPPIEDQGMLNSCSAQAVIGMVEYLVRAGGGERPDLSRMFLYKLARMLDGTKGNVGTYLRSAIKALRLFGVPPEDYWPYAAELLDAEPQALQYAFAGNWKAINYYRVDQDGFSGKNTLDLVRLLLADRFPVALGFSLFQSIGQMGADHMIPFPDGREGADRQVGSHAVLAVGYDNDVGVTYPCPIVTAKPPKRPLGNKRKKLKAKPLPEEERGALIIRNSWGSEWGDWGYAYLPYRYVLDRLVVDCWTILKADSLPTI